ncbi:MAG: error-prone DNA polymerase [Deltaproteobacteria bacterium]|nr:error-prone DNA polymerase [Deltaproteobacteria bacterium]
MNNSRDFFMHTPYVELQTKSNYSFLYGASYPEELIKAAAKLGYPAVALTDHCTLSGIVRAHAAAKEEQIRLIVGNHITLSENTDPQLNLLLYPYSLTGYNNLCLLLTEGKRRTTKGQCLLGVEDLARFYKDWIIIACIDKFTENKLSADLKKIQNLTENHHLYIRITRHYHSFEARLLHQITRCSQLLDIPLIACNDVLYHSAQRKQLQDVLTCIRHKTKLSQAGFLLAANAERHLKTPMEMQRLFRAYPQALKNTLSVSEMTSSFSLDQLKYDYPHEICPNNLAPQDYLKTLADQGLNERYPGGIPTKVKTQVAHELAVIKELDYAKYFLTVYDLVSFARKNGILCQGRGAAANSAVCYVLGITAVDPDKINLLFERFISKERNEPPDIDLDFEHERREEVIQYLYHKYGRDRAALVCEVITYRTRSAFREVGKVFGLSPSLIAKLLKAVRLYRNHLDQSGQNKDKTAWQNILKTHGFNSYDTSIKQIIKLSLSIKGFPRHLSQHVGGFVLSEQKLSALVPIENAAMENRSVMEWDKNDIDYLGILKIDVLALGMLTAIRKSLALINNQHGSWPQWSHQQLLLHNIPPEDANVYQMISRADTMGVFQIESRAQMSMLPRLRPSCFYDLVIEVAIVRPGPIQGGIIHPYLRRRNGEEQITYPDNKIKSFLESTLGVPIFQEQIMQLAIVGAEFTAGEADQLRRALGNWKRNKNLVRTFGKKLFLGMKNNGYPLLFIKQCLGQIKGFAEYGFPQSHAASFALLVYVSAWLKCHHPASFGVGLLNSQPMGFYQPAQIVSDLKTHGVKVLPIDVLASNWDCTLEKSNEIRLGLRLVKGLSKKDAELIVSCRHEVFPSSLEALWRKSGVSTHGLRCLAQADAFCSLGYSRQAALWKIRSFKNKPLPLLETLAEDEQISSLPQISESLDILWDYQSFGLSLKGHPLELLRAQLNTNNVLTISEAKTNVPHGETIIVGGLVIVRQQPYTAKGTVFFTLEDETGILNLVIKQRWFQELNNTLNENNLILFRGQLQKSNNVITLSIDDALGIDHIFNRLTHVSRDFY